MGIPEPETKVDAYPFQLSGGQQQRVMIAMAIACEPKLLIADEPTTALDVTVQKQILELIAALQRKHRMSMLFITHDLAVVGEIADSVVVMREGRIREQGTARTIFESPQDAYTKALLACRPRFASRPRRLPVIDDFLRGATLDDPRLPQRSRGLKGDEEIVLEARHLAKSFYFREGLFGRREVKAVKDASFRLPRGKTLGLVGESGSGKTTLGLMLMRLHEATGGEVRFEGKDLLALPPRALREAKRRIQIVFQNPYASLNPRFTAGQILIEPMKIHSIGADAAARRRLAFELLEKVGLPAARVLQVSSRVLGGQRQRIAIARCLTMKPDVLICDESVSALDVSIQAQLLNLLQDLQDEFRMSYLFISHDLAVVKYMADQVMVMSEGEIVEIGRFRCHLFQPAASVHEEAARLDAAGLAEEGRVIRVFLALCLGLAGTAACAAHGYGQFGDLKYPAGFANFEWVNPDAPKGGSIDLVPPLRITNFDKYNPFTLKGTAPPGLTSLVFESLLTGTMDEPTTAYGLLAEDVQVAPDGLSVTFRLNPAARFHDGKPVMAADVKHSFDMLMSKLAAPQYRVVFGDVKQAVVTGPLSVRFEFIRANAELPLMVGGLPVFSREWGGGKPFDQIILDYPIASGPYRIGRMNFGRDITYDRDPNYWARDLNVRRGMYNFDRITYKIYQDNTAQTEAFKAGEFDYMRSFSAREWARTYTGKKFDSGELIKAELESKNAGDFQGYLINTRREKFKDPRVREALGLAFDFEWMNRKLFYNGYIRVRGYFNGSDFEAKGMPGPRRTRGTGTPAREAAGKGFQRGSAAAAQHESAGQPARQPAQGERPARRGRMDLSRRVLCAMRAERR